MSKLLERLLALFTVPDSLPATAERRRMLIDYQRTEFYND